MAKHSIKFGMAENAIEQLLTAIYGKEWQDDKNFTGTPERVARAYSELLRYERTDKRADALQHTLKTTFPSTHTSMIFAPGITVSSMCPHHLLPVRYSITIGYIPAKDGFVLGASKLERVARILGARAILQEDLTNEIADVIETRIKPSGVAVVVSGIHDCMTVRGIKGRGSFETSEMRGGFKDNKETREEFFDLLKISFMRNQI